jgi:hypothetical protein
MRCTLQPEAIYSCNRKRGYLMCEGWRLVAQMAQAACFGAQTNPSVQRRHHVLHSAATADMQGTTCEIVGV